MTNVTLPFFFFAFPVFSTIIKAYSTVKGAAKAGITMKNAVNCGLVMLLCMFSLFFVQPDLPYVLAFLCALILCSADLFLEEDRTYTAG